MTKNMTTEQFEEVMRGLVEMHFYYDKEIDGIYYTELVADYRDELDKKTIEEILQSNNPLDEFYSLVWEAYIDSDLSEYNYIFETIESNWDEEEYGAYDEHEDFIVEWIFEHIRFDIPYSHYLKQDVNVNIVVDVGDGNYDFSLNNFASYNAIKDESIDNNSSVLWLVKQQGYTKKDLSNAISKENFKDSKFLKSIFAELVNATTHMNALVFFVKMELGEFFKYLEEPYDLILPANINCGLVDFWQGAGSVLGIELEKEAKIPKEFVQVHVDGNRGYGLQDIYGINDGLWN